MLELQEVSSFYGNSPILRKVNFTVNKGELVTVLGRNGVGKTTLMRTIMGLTDRLIGSLIFDGDKLNDLPTYVRAKRGIAYVPQGRGILPKFTVRENILMGTFARNENSRELPELALEMFPYLKENLHRRAGNLSGGQQQQLAIARALAASPKAILLDEPTEGIQPNIVEQIEEVIIKLNKEKQLTIVLVEQNVSFSRRASDKFVILEKGRVVVDDDIDGLTEDVVHQYMTV